MFNLKKYRSSDPISILKQMAKLRRKEVSDHRVYQSVGVQTEHLAHSRFVNSLDSLQQEVIFYGYCIHTTISHIPLFEMQSFHLSKRE